MRQKVLITGISGFIGHHLAKKLINNGYEIVGIDNLNDYYDVNLKLFRLNDLGIKKERISENKISNENLTFYKADITNFNELNQIFETEHFDIVIHLAAQAGVRYSIENPQAYIDSNITGFFNILEVLRKYPVKHFIFASSSSVYGLNEEIPFKTSHHTDHPVSLYAATKKSNEMLAHSYAHLYQIPTTGLRFFTVYGPYGRPDMALHLFTEAIFNNRELNVFNYGQMQRDFTYIDDITESIYRLLPLAPKPNQGVFNPKLPNPAISTAPYRLFNIGNNQPVALMDFIKAIEKVTGKKAQLNMMPMQAGDVQITYADVSDLFAYINYKPQTQLIDGVKAFVDAYKHYYQNTCR
ncbi:MAG TPA: NAD-dependent epimerase/dehydratase family protein [Flavobacteriales bacterium]|nr:NAD-dependent epimerase/dehydratase family protein [Flavobacteriales bacterium]